MQTQTARVTIERVEGRTTDLLSATFYGENALREAGARLQQWAETAPQEGGGYHKVDVQVVWEGNTTGERRSEVYQTRYDLTRDDVTGVDLAAHVERQRNPAEDYKLLMEFSGLGGTVVKQPGEKL